MTAQIPDRLVLDERTYAVAGAEGEGLFDPAAFGLSPAGTCTACWRGYVCQYGIADERLILDRLEVSLKRLEGGDFLSRRGPAINGVEPVAPEGEHAFFNNVYERLGLPLDFTGELLIADDFIQELYVHMGFHPAWKYETVLELSFDAGRLLAVRDVSAAMARIRREKS
jgi:hypothetical protein